MPGKEETEARVAGKQPALSLSSSLNSSYWPDTRRKAPTTSNKIHKCESASLCSGHRKSHLHELTISIILQGLTQGNIWKQLEAPCIFSNVELLSRLLTALQRITKTTNQPTLILYEARFRSTLETSFLIQAAKRPLNYCRCLTFQTSDTAGKRQPRRISGYSTQMISPDSVQNKSVPKVQTPRMQENLSLLSLLSQGFWIFTKRKCLFMILSNHGFMLRFLAGSYKIAQYCIHKINCRPYF